MPKNTVSDLITDQEMVFARLIMSGTMNDRAAAEAAGLNPRTAAYTKAKPRVRAYMNELRAAMKEKLVDHEADLSRLAADRAVERQRKLDLVRGQVLDRLWELAALSQEATKGSIAGQIKALAMIAAIEGLIPDRRLSPSATQPAAPPVKPQIYQSAWLRKQKQEAAEESGDPVADAEAQTEAPHLPDPEPAPNSDPEAANAAHPDLNPDRNLPTLPDPLIQPALNRVPDATNSGFDVYLDTTSSLRQPFSIRTGPFARRR